MGDERPVQWRSHNVSHSPRYYKGACRHDTNFRRGISGGSQMLFYVQMWFPLLTVALTAAICFSVVSFIMGRRVKPRQL